MEEFLERVTDELNHAEKIPERIIQLNGELNLIAQGTLTRSHPEDVEGETLVDMIREDLIAERIGIEFCSEIIRYLGGADHSHPANVGRDSRQ